MTTAQTIFLVYGVLVLAYGFILGVPLAAERMHAPRAQRHLVMTHLSAIIQGAIHLGLAFAVGLVDLSSGWTTGAASLIVAASALETIGGTINWLTRTDDQFAEKSLGFRFNTLVGPPAIVGSLILVLGALRSI